MISSLKLPRSGCAKFYRKQTREYYCKNANPTWSCQSILFVYLLFDSEADLNELKDSISYLKASDKDCCEASFCVEFPVNK